MKDFECLGHSSGEMNVMIKKRKKEEEVRLRPMYGKCVKVSVYSRAWKYFLYCIFLVKGDCIELVTLEGHGLDRKMSWLCAKFLRVGCILTRKR